MRRFLKEGQSNGWGVSEGGGEKKKGDGSGWGCVLGGLLRDVLAVSGECGRAGGGGLV